MGTLEHHLNHYEGLRISSNLISFYYLQSHIEKMTIHWLCVALPITCHARTFTCVLLVNLVDLMNNLNVLKKNYLFLVIVGCTSSTQRRDHVLNVVHKKQRSIQPFKQKTQRSTIDTSNYMHMISLSLFSFGPLVVHYCP